MFKDVFGLELQAGDIVTYPTQHGHYLSVEVAEILRFNAQSVVVQLLVGGRLVALRRVDNITRTRYSREEADALLSASQAREGMSE